MWQNKYQPCLEQSSNFSVDFLENYVFITSQKRPYLTAFSQQNDEIIYWLLVNYKEMSAKLVKRLVIRVCG